MKVRVSAAILAQGHFMLEVVVAKARSTDCLLVPLFASLSAEQVNGPQRMVSGRCSDGMGANRAWSSAKVCDMATCEQSAHEATGGIREATRRSEAQGWCHRRRPRLSPEAVVEVSLSKVAKLEKAPRGVGRHGRSSLRGDAGRVEACQVCCVGLSSRGPKSESPI